MMEKAIKEALLEMGRVMVLAAIPLLIDGLSKNMIDWRLVAVSVAIAGLRFIDKLLHEWGKESENPRLSKGLTRF